VGFVVSNLGTGRKTTGIRKGWNNPEKNDQEFQNLAVICQLNPLHHEKTYLMIFRSLYDFYHPEPAVIYLKDYSLSLRKSSDIAFNR
jgi:hypothetical protein